MNREQRRAAARRGEILLGSRTAGKELTTVTPSAAQLLQAGIVRQQAGRLAEAEAHYRRVLTIVPNHPDALHLLGLIASAAGQHDRAAELIGKAIQRNQNNPAYYGNRGVALQNLKRPDEAVDCYDRAIELDPNLAEAYYNRGNALRDLGRLEEAVISYDRAIALKPKVAEAHSNRGRALRDLRRLNEAVASYDQAIACNPDLAEAHYNRGNILRDLNHQKQAVESYDRAIALKPDMAEAYCNRGIALADLNRLDEALESYDRALSVWPDDANAFINRGLAFHRLERFDEALESYDRALIIRPDDPKVLNNRGDALLVSNRFAKALESYDRALAVGPNDAEALNNRGLALQRLKRFTEALQSFDRALAVRPDYAEALINRAPALRELQRFDEALESCERALSIRPDYAEGLLNRGNTLKELERFNEALEDYDRALAVRPRYAEALNNRGVVLNDLDCLKEALESYERALAVRPDYAEALVNRGTTLEQVERFDEAINSYDRALAVNPDAEALQLAQFNKALLLLRMGRFPESWEGYEWRRKSKSWTSRPLSGPEWDGSDPTNRRLLFYSEQGLGDTIQFSRFACCAAARGAEALLEVQPPLQGLLTSLAGVKVFPQGEPLPEYDAHLPLMSLPHVLSVTPERMAAKMPYLSAPPDRVEAWKKRLPAGQFRIGIAWQGRAVREVDKGRSIPLRAFAPLCQIPGLTLISLQKHDGMEQLANLPPSMRVEMLGEEFDSEVAFLDSAAVMMNLDLVICCDTSIAHLAGALGRPLWLVLKRVPDWRWMIERGDTPWYPTARLFRQRRPGDWNEVFARVTAELAQVVSGERDRLLPQRRLTAPNEQRFPSRADAGDAASREGDPRATAFAATVLKECRHGRMLFLKRDIYIGRSLDLYGEFSEMEVEVFGQLLRLGDVVIEAGANIGAHTVPIASLVGRSGLVLAFEPQRVIFQLLCANIALNELFNVRTYHSAVGRDTGTITVPSVDYMTAGNFGGVSLNKSRTGEEVQLWKLDSMSLPSLRMLKADVEGMELEVLHGARETIGRFRPILYVENDRQAQSTELITLIDDLGYEMWWHLPWLYNPNNFNKNPENVFSRIVSVNLLCFPKEAVANITGLRRVSGPQDWWQGPRRAGDTG